MSKNFNRDKDISHFTFDKSKEIIIFNFVGSKFYFNLKSLNFDDFNISKRMTKNTYFFFCLRRLLKRLGLV